MLHVLHVMLHVLRFLCVYHYAAC